MASPVTTDTIPTITGSMEACDANKALLEAVNQLRFLVGWLFDDEGLPKVQAVREFGSVLFIPGMVIDVVIAQSTPRDGQGGVREQIETMWLTDEEIAAYRDDRNSVEPFWVLCDEERKSGAPDMSGRVRVNADFRALETNVLGVQGIAPAGGSKDHVLVADELPEHTHILKVPSAEGTQADPQGGRFLYTPRDSGGIGGGGSDVSTWPQMTLTPESVGAGEAHNNLQPYYVVVTAMRTTRTS